MSEETKRYKQLHWICRITSIVLTFVPLIVFVIIGFVQGSATSKFTLGCTVMIAAILTFANIVMKYHLRSVIWILLLGIYAALDSIMPLIICVAVATIVDEFILSPLAKRYKELFTINNQIDKRIPIKKHDEAGE